MNYQDIKFRAWHKEQKKMYMVSAIDISNELIVLHSCDGLEKGILVRSDKVELMMYTGQQDKYGVEIYEGDVIEISNIIDIIYWNEDYSCFSGADLSGFDSGSYSIGAEYVRSRKIIGNKYENPELI